MCGEDTLSRNMDEKLVALQKIDARRRAISLSVQGILGAAVMSMVGLTGWFTGTFVVSDPVGTHDPMMFVCDKVVMSTTKMSLHDALSQARTFSPASDDFLLRVVVCSLLSFQTVDIIHVAGTFVTVFFVISNWTSAAVDIPTQVSNVFISSRRSVLSPIDFFLVGNRSVSVVLVPVMELRVLASTKLTCLPCDSTCVPTQIRFFLGERQRLVSCLTSVTCIHT